MTDHVKAVDGVSFQLREGHTLGVVGESGSGKTTLGLAFLRLVASEGEIRFAGQTIDGLGGSALRPLRRQMQIVFQDPFGSLSPRMSIAEIVERRARGAWAGPRPRRARPAGERGADARSASIPPAASATPMNSPAASASGSPSPAP